MRAILLTAILIFTALPVWAAKLTDFQSPRLKGDVLYIHGRLNSHIYDYLTREKQRLAQVRIVDLNSLGGNMEWALMIANRLRTMNVTTRLSENSFCASACVFLFGAGVKRIAAPGTWFGIHAARLSAGEAMRFEELCYRKDKFSPERRSCRKALVDWQGLAAKTTRAAFQSLEQNGVLPELYRNYMSFPDQENWADDFNVLKKPDWVVPSELALEYNLLTEPWPYQLAETPPDPSIGNTAPGWAKNGLR